MKYYAIKKGRKPGIYTNWPEAKKQIDGFSGAVYRGFTTEDAARDFIEGQKKQLVISDDAVLVFTDGGSRNTGNVAGGHVKNNDKAAWAYLIQDHGQKYSDSKGEFGATNNKMELTALIQSLQRLISLDKQETEIAVISDSKYLINAITQGWLNGWKNRNWKKADGSVPANVELWQQLDQLLPQFKKLQITWTKGHAENEGNNLVDQLLNETMDKM